MKRNREVPHSMRNFIFSVLLLLFSLQQEILNDQRMAFDFVDILTVVFNYCGSKLVESQSNEMKVIVKDIIVILGYFTVNNRANQVSNQQTPGHGRALIVIAAVD